MKEDIFAVEESGTEFSTRPFGRELKGHVPSQEEIRSACREIQKEWTDKERRRRSGLRRAFWLGKVTAGSRVWLP